MLKGIYGKRIGRTIFLGVALWVTVAGLLPRESPGQPKEKPEDQVAILLDHLKDEDPQVRQSAAQFLVSFAKTQNGTVLAPVIPPLIELLQDPDVEVRYWGAAALGFTGATIEDEEILGPAIPSLIEALQDQGLALGLTSLLRTT